MPQIAEAQDILTRVNSDPEARELWRMREKAIYDESSALAYAKTEGKEEGEKAKATKIAKEMKVDGMDNKKIQHYTGLSIEEISVHDKTSSYRSRTT